MLILSSALSAEPLRQGLLTYMSLLQRVLSSIQSAKASYAQLPDIPLRSDIQALRLIARIPLIQRREKCPSREGKKRLPVVVFLYLRT